MLANAFTLSSSYFSSLLKIDCVAIYCTYATCIFIIYLCIFLLYIYSYIFIIHIYLYSIYIEYIYLLYTCIYSWLCPVLIR